MKPLEIHPLAELIPPMSDEEFAELRDDIKSNGLREPVTLFEGRLLDGRHRVRACDELGIRPKTRPYEGDDPAEYVISLNLRRRHLTVGQRSAAALALLDYEREQARKRLKEGQERGRASQRGETVSPQSGGDRHQTEATAKAAERLGTSRTSVERAARLAKDRPDLLERVTKGELSVSGATELMTGKSTKTGEPIDTSAPKPKPPKVGKRETAQARSRLENLIHTFTNTQMLLRETNAEAAIDALNAKEKTEWAAQLRSVRTDVSRLIGALEASG